jgi:TrmH family RNA methyltransferase|tara:strand:- start:1076 stop:1861 length:786 start_codon:yes stop_codon:yes gene_type:complete
MKIISSKNNPKIRYVKKIRSSNSFRKKERKFYVEGLKELKLCIESGFCIDSIYCSSKSKKILENNFIKPDYVINDIIISQIIMRETEGIFGVFDEKTDHIDTSKLSNNELILILDRPEKPGNVGAIFRTFEAFGFKNIFISETNLDIYNPIIIRSSLGAVFNLNIFKLSFHEIEKLLKKEKFKIIISDVDAEINYNKVNLKDKTAIVMGPEKSKVSDDFKKISDHIIKIPMYGKIDSLNLSVATSIILSESINQRKSLKFR